MVTLKGKNLGERQKELNECVKEAFANNVSLDKVPEIDNNDLHTFLKIDLASKYLNIEFIINILKSGDGLHISRALKCTWMFDDEYANIINAEYLHQNIFPSMSAKMRKKFLTIISRHVKNKERAAAFYKYCMKAKLQNIALKFLIYTSYEFKLNELKQDNNFAFMIYNSEGNYMKHIIGNSFTLADAYITALESLYYRQKLCVLIDLCYLSSISDVKYLDLLERHLEVNNPDKRFGLRFSKKVLEKHKNRVLSKPQLYVKILNKDVLVKFSTIHDAKIYLAALIKPQNKETFWQANFMAYEYIINIIPAEERFEYLKTIFKNTYPNESFEYDINFYHQEYYTFMTAEQKETWASDNINNSKELFGIGNDYIWNKFINFDRAFQNIKKLIMVTTDKDKRAEIVNILIESAKTQIDLEQLFAYYYSRHVNEPTYKKENFLCEVSKHHNVFEFDQDCWAAFNKILHSLDVYSTLDNNSKSNYKIIILIYSIINKRTVHDAINLFINTNMYFYALKLNTDKLPQEQQDMVYQYLYKHYIDEINKHGSQAYTEDVKLKLRTYLELFLNLIYQYNKTKNDIPENVTKFIELDWDEFSCHSLFHKQEMKKITIGDLLRCLKKDVKLAVEKLPDIQKRIEYGYCFNMSMVLRKLKLYFPGDVTKEFISFFQNMLESKNVYLKEANAAVHALIQLADDNMKSDLILKYAPTEPKIKYDEIDKKLLNNQKAICAHLLYARPPVPLKLMLMYIKGDYVHFSLPLFNSNLANLPPSLCTEFIEAILDAPVSVQKHGLRLAFLCFNEENIKKKFVHIWKRTKNVSLRVIIFKAIFNKFIDDLQGRATYFDILKSFTMDLKDDDDSAIFSLITSVYSFPDEYVSEFISTVWATVSKFNKKAANINYMTSVINAMRNKIEFMSENIVLDIINEFFGVLFDNTPPEMDKLYRAKWELATSYITFLPSEDSFQSKFPLVESVLKHLDPPSKDIPSDVREKCKEFVRDLEDTSFGNPVNTYKNINKLFVSVLESLEKKLSPEKIYILVWSLKLGILARTVIFKAQNEINTDIADNTTLRAIGIEFARGLGTLIKEYVKRQSYCMSLTEDVIEEVSDKISTMKYGIFRSLEQFDVIVVVSFGLVAFDTTEAYLLALNLLPPNYCGQYEEDFKYVLNKLKGVENINVRYKLYHKFINRLDAPISD